MSSADEGAAGISASLGDEGTALQRAQDKIATIRARADVLDELPSPECPKTPAAAPTTSSRNPAKPGRRRSGHGARRA